MAIHGSPEALSSLWLLMLIARLRWGGDEATSHLQAVKSNRGLLLSSTAANIAGTAVPYSQLRWHSIQPLHRAAMLVCLGRLWVTVVLFPSAICAWTVFLWQP